MMDEKDRKILKLIQGNARMSYEEIGRELGMSRVAAKKRVQKLEQEGIIRGYNTCIYRDGEIKAFMDVTTTAEGLEDVLEYVSAQAAWVRQIFRMAKPNHIFLVVVAPSSDDLRYLADFIARHDSVKTIRLNAAAEVIKDVYGGIRKYGKKSVDDGTEQEEQDQQ